MTNVFHQLKSLAIAAPVAAMALFPMAPAAHAASLPHTVAPSIRADERDFTLVNNTSASFNHVFVSPSDVEDWGDDVLGKDVRDAGENVFIYFKRFTPGGCAYDIRVVADDGREGKLLNVDLCSIDTVTFSD